MPKVTTDAAMTSEMIAILRETMAKSHASGQTKRGAHAKSHGLLKAQFVVALTQLKRYRTKVIASAEMLPKSDSRR